MRQFRDGLDVWTPPHRRVAPDMLSPRARTHNYLNLIVADQSVKAHDPEAWAELLDANGNLCEGIGSISLLFATASSLPQASATFFPASAVR